MSYAVKELFYTLQGEGGNTGRAAVFCRFTGCNLWTGRAEDRARAICQFCDTDFVGTDGTGGGRFATAAELAAAAKSVWEANGERSAARPENVMGIGKQSALRPESASGIAEQSALGSKSELGIGKQSALRPESASGIAEQSALGSKSELGIGEQSALGPESVIGIGEQSAVRPESGLGIGEQSAARPASVTKLNEQSVTRHAPAMDAVEPSSSVRPLVVCTGGEPLLQLDAPLIAAFHAVGFEVAIETNGTLELPADSAPEGRIDWVCVSPKAGAPLRLSSGDELKLIFPQPGAEPERYAHLPFQRFFLQPMDGPARAENTSLAVRYCLLHPQWRLSLQTHKLLGIP